MFSKLEKQIDIVYRLFTWSSYDFMNFQCSSLNG